MSRLYDNTPLTNLPQINTTWPESWNTKKWTKDGSGVLVEACIKAKSRIAVTDNSNKKASTRLLFVKYYILHVETGRAHKRKFDANGKEIEPNFSETTKVLTGYLNSSYKTEAKGQTDKLSQTEIVNMIEKSELKKISDKSAQTNTISFWIEESELQKMELESGDVVRMKTKGNSPFIYTIGKVEGDSCKVSNFAGGDQVGASWTEKIRSIQPPSTVKSNADEIGDDEWDD
ncbi:hypothetical protein LOTGIDRAFT_218129 [Lottia gigantea]|uniref:Arpin n=1 Tax=Lottia gigantea TaxID=225164 RepID=V4A512_LOTGI|nr:hypothetical protein LOTGIDRAFT_218129 [Lottia gigantea]ESO90090.1 hypothetical protein LOTGIDRAFT_218129 [Lottia gigantea]